MQLPETVSWNGHDFTLSIYINDDGNHAVEYVYPDDIFPVAFANETEQEARDLMYGWLLENGLV